MTKEDLLKASIAEFEDRKNNALFWDCKRIITKSGYCYIIKQQSRPISCAIHFNRSFETDEAVGKYENNDFAINTREELNYHGLLEYKGMHFAITSAGNYNETMAQYHYQGSGAFKPISDMFLVTDEKEIQSKIGVDCIPLFIEIGETLGIPTLPSYYEATYSNKQYILVSCENISTISPVVKEGEVFVQRKIDNVTLSLVNFTTQEAMRYIEMMQQESLKPGAKFGFASLPDLKEKTIHQMSFDWKALSYTSEFQIHYAITSQNDETNVIIREVFFKMLGAL